MAFCWVCVSQGTGTGRRNGPPGSLGPLRGCSGTRKGRGSGRNCCSAPDGEQKKKKRKLSLAKILPAALMPSDVSRRLRDVSFFYISLILHGHFRFTFTPTHMRVSGKANTHLHRRLETMLEAEEHVFLRIPKKKKCVSNFSQIVSKRTLIPPQSVDSTPRP